MQGLRKARGRAKCPVRDLNREQELAAALSNVSLGLTPALEAQVGGLSVLGDTCLTAGSRLFA